jgi:hypothetical protein
MNQLPVKNERSTASTRSATRGGGGGIRDDGSGVRGDSGDSVVLAASHMSSPVQDSLYQTSTWWVGV